jgi:hypothetical protein
MNNFNRWAVIVGALVLALVVGAMAYNAGIARGIEQSGKIVVAAPGAYPYPYHYGRPWGSGFFFAPFFFVLFWFLIVRAVFWRGGWHRRGCGADSRFDDWHRRAHERMWNEPGSGAGPEK